MSERDDALEDAAQAIEHPDFAEFRGVLSKTKKGQREYEIRIEAIRETKQRMARYIRSLKTENGNDIRRSLERAADFGDNEIYDYRDAWKMADLGWIDIFVTIEATSKSIPARAHHAIKLTPRGHRVLDAWRTETAQIDEHQPLSAENETWAGT